MADRLYTITAQRPATIVTPTNQVVDGIELHVDGGSGIAFVVTVPANATPEYIDQVIRSRLNLHLQVAQLGEQ